MSLSASALSGAAFVPSLAISHGAEGASSPKRAGVGSRHTASKTEDDGDSSRDTLPALCAFAEVKPAPDQDAASKARPFASIWNSAVETGEAESSAADPGLFSIPSQPVASAESVLAGNDVPALMRMALAGIAGRPETTDSSLPPNDRLAGRIAALSQARRSLHEVLALQASGAETVSEADAEGNRADENSPAPHDARVLAKADGSTELQNALESNMAANVKTAGPGPQGADRSAERQTKGEKQGSQSGEPSLARFTSAAGSNLEWISKLLVSSEGDEPRDKGAAPPRVATPGSSDAGQVPNPAVTASAVEPAAGAAGPAPAPAQKTPRSGIAASLQRQTSSVFNGSTSMFGVDAPAAPERLDPKAQSEIAFEAELSANTSKSSAEPQPVKGQPSTQAIVAAAAIDRGAAAAQTTVPEVPGGRAAEATAEPVAGLERSSDDAGGGTGSSHDQNDGADIGRGPRQPALPFSHDAAAASLKVPIEGAGAVKQAAPPAAHLDAHLSEPTVANEQPARSLAMKIHSEEHGSASVVLTDRGGQVHVTVRAADPSLTQSLRSELNSLAGGLEQQGFAVKVWHPSAGSSMDGDRRGHAAESAGPDDTGNQPRQDQHPGDEGHRNRRQPEWMEELD